MAGWCVGKVSGVKNAYFYLRRDSRHRQQAMRLHKKWDENSWKKIRGDEKLGVHPPRQFFLSIWSIIRPLISGHQYRCWPQLLPPPTPLWIAKSFYYIALFYLLAMLERKMNHATHQKNPKKSKIWHFLDRVFFNPRRALMLRPKFQTFYNYKKVTLGSEDFSTKIISSC